MNNIILNAPGVHERGSWAATVDKKPNEQSVSALACPGVRPLLRCTEPRPLWVKSTHAIGALNVFLIPPKAAEDVAAPKQGLPS
jgi:hypothetical protein